MKVQKLVSKNQPSDWFYTITEECRREYPINLIDISPDELVIDMGCNVGGFTEAFKDRFHNIIAVEASSYNVDEYKKRHPYLIFHKAAYSKDGEILKLKKYMGNADDDTNSGNFSIIDFIYEHNNHGFRGDEYEEVETISINTLIDTYGDIGLLKIDIEGAEYDVLYKKDLSRIKYITGEIHNFLGVEKHIELFKWIEKTHEEIYTIGHGIESHYLKMWKRR